MKSDFLLVGRGNHRPDDLVGRCVVQGIEAGQELIGGRALPEDLLDTEIDCLLGKHALEGDIRRGVSALHHAALEEVDQAIHVKDLALDPDIAILSDPEQLIVKISEKAMAKVEEEEVVEVAEEAAPVTEEEAPEEKPAE